MCVMKNLAVASAVVCDAVRFRCTILVPRPGYLSTVSYVEFNGTWVAMEANSIHADVEYENMWIGVQRMLKLCERGLRIPKLSESNG